MKNLISQWRICWRQSSEGNEEFWEALFKVMKYFLWRQWKNPHEGNEELQEGYEEGIAESR